MQNRLSHLWVDTAFDRESARNSHAAAAYGLDTGSASADLQILY